MVRVFAYQVDPAGCPPEEIAEQAFDICNGPPRGAAGDELPAPITSSSRCRCPSGMWWPSARSRSAVGRAGWEPVTGRLNVVRTREHGTRPLPAPGRGWRTRARIPRKEYRDACP